MFSSNYLSQRNPNIHSQSCYEVPFHPSLFESYNNCPQANPYQPSNLSISESNSNLMSQKQLLYSQLSNMTSNNLGARKPTKQSFTSSNFINYKQFENIFIEKIRDFPTQVNNYLTKEEENINLKILVDSINNASSITNQNLNKINEIYCPKLSNSNCTVPQLFEICSKINEILNNIDNELLNQFSSLTSFHGYDESVQNNEKINLTKIQNIINECNEIMKEKIIKINENSLNFNNDIILNCEQFKIMLEEEMQKLNQNLNELIKYKSEQNIKYSIYQKITDNIINSINSLKNRFIYINHVKNDEEKIDEKDKNNNFVEKKDINSNVDNSNKAQIDQDSKLQNKMATMKIINIMHNRNKRKKIK